MGLCTKDPVVFEVGMEWHGNRFCSSDHSTVSLETLKETLFNRTQMQLQNDGRGVHDRVVEDVRRDDHWSKEVMTTSVAQIVTHDRENSDSLEHDRPATPQAGGRSPR